MTDKDASEPGYAAFISYRHVDPDRSWAHWLHRALEGYRVPPALVARGHRARLGRVFRDEEELAASHDLSSEIEQALQGSQYLIVVCSPRTPESQWVNREIERFHEMGRADRVLALLIEGEPRDAFPPALRAIRPAAEGHLQVYEVEPLAADVRPMEGESPRVRRRMALLRTAAKVIGCRFDELRQRDAARARKRRLVFGTVLCALVALFGALALWALEQRDEKADALRRLTEHLGLSDAGAFSHWMRQEETLWPLHPDTQARIDDWLTHGERLRSNETIHRRALDELRARGTEAADGTWTFAMREDARRHDALTRLFADIESTFERDDGLVGRVRKRRERAARLAADTIEAYREAWERSIVAIAASPNYDGLRITPQLGLIPLGPDPDSGLHEFAHWGSGSIPRRDDDGRLVLQDDTAIVLVLIPAGSFVMGAQAKDKDGPNYHAHALPWEAPAFPSAITKPFFLGKFECTRPQWRALGSTRFSKFRTDNGGITARHPMENVTWFEAGRWLRRHRLTLPTEAQWEYACRRGLPPQHDAWTHGRDWSSLARFANTADAAYGTRTNAPPGTFRTDMDDGHRLHAPVGSFAADGLGLHDMLGNVSEWVLDVLDYRDKPARDPLRMLTGDATRVARGGGFENLAEHARCSARFWPNPEDRTGDLGVRAARGLDAE